ncbi:MAG: hypothetical protein ABEJ31_09265 [Haloarculaceae archaeon]
MSDILENVRSELPRYPDDVPRLGGDTDDDTRSRLSRRRVMAAAGTALPVALAGCSLGGGDPSQQATTTTTTKTPAERSPPGKLSVSTDSAVVGDTLTLTASGLPATEQVSVVWHSVDGRWALIKHMNVVGPKYSPRTDTITTGQTDADGRFKTEWTIPEDYGGKHRIEVQGSNGKTLARNAVSVGPTFTIDRTSAPLGSTFTVESHGLGPSQFKTNYQLGWDNAQAGLLTAVSSRGHSRAKLRAAGPTGTHMIEVFRGYKGAPFLVAPQSPFGAVAGGRTHAWKVEVTEPTADLKTSWSDPLRDTEPVPVFYPDLDEQTDASLSVSPTSGVAGDEATISGSGFPAREQVDLVWYTISGSRVTSAPIKKVPKPDQLPTVRTDSSGSFEQTVTIPSDKGGTRPIVARVGGKSVAVTGFVMEPSVVGLSQEQGPVGTEFDVKVSGIGWTEYGNTYGLTYDNKYLGYGCGMDESGGVIEFTLRAAGEPGPHFVDLYPSLYRADDNPPDMYGGKAQLSFRDDHPGHPTPSLHFTFQVTE